MKNRGFKPVAVPDGLSKIAKTLPTQSVETKEELKPKPTTEPRVQLTMKVRKSLRDELRTKAVEQGMTVQAFVMGALKDKGLKIIEEDLMDLRSR